MTRVKIRALVAIGATLTLLLAACGTRLGDDQILHAAAGEPGNAGTGPVAGPLGTGGTARDASAGPADHNTTGRPGATDEKGTSGGKAPKRGDAGSTASGRPLVIGSVGTYSGPVGVAFQDTPRALQAWAATTNAKGGINGRPVKVVVYDDGGDSSKARSYVKSLVEQHKAVAMVASITNAQSMKAWLPYVEQQKFPVIGECGLAAHSSPMVFSPCPTLADAAYGTILIGARHGKSKKFGALFCSESDDCSFVDDQWWAKGQAKKAGLDPRYRAKISITQPDFTSECIQARNAGVELFAVIGDANTVSRVAASCRRQNFNPQYLQPDVTIAADTPTKPGLGNVLGAARVFPFAGLSTAAFKDFEAAWKRYGGGKAPAGSAAIGWASAKIFEKAVVGADKNVNRAGLVTQLRKMSNDRFGGLTVPLTFTGSLPRPASCMFLMQGNSGKWTAPKGDKPICF